MRRLVVVAIACAAVFGLSSPELLAASGQTAGSQTCVKYFNVFRYKNHEYEVCSAYLLNSTRESLLWFYKYGKSDVPARSNAAYSRLLSRYAIPKDPSGFVLTPAFKVITNRVNKWPKGEKDVSFPSISVSNLHSNLESFRAVFYSQESWKVYTKSEKPVYVRTERHGVTMCKVPSLVLHKWVVVKFSIDNNFNCARYNQ